MKNQKLQQLRQWEKVRKISIYVYEVCHNKILKIYLRYVFITKFVFEGVLQLEVQYL